MNKLSFRIILIICICIIVYLIGSIIKCELLTNKYGSEFLRFEEINQAETYKILTYTHNYARVYCISTNKQNGTVHNFIKSDGSWTYNQWEDGGWSKHGTADEIVWPYWWHIIYFYF